MEINVNDDAVTVDMLLEEAEKEIKNVPKGTVFLVKDLFKGYIWNRIPVKNRLLLGTLFLHYANNAEYIEPAGKTASNQQKYMKL